MLKMTKWIWNGEIDFAWEELSQFITNKCDEFTKTMLETTSFSPNEESKVLISSECLERYKNLTQLLSESMKDYPYYYCGDLGDDLQNAKKLNSWILLGSLTETTLQIFLAFYMDDYKNTKWQLWDNFKTEETLQPIIKFIDDDLIGKGELSSKQGKSIKKAVNEVIKKHTVEHDIKKIMLDELIQLFRKLELFDDNDLNFLEKIKANRNGIHSFENREIGSWEELHYCIHFFCYLMEWVLFRLPDIPDEAYFY